jgi:GxxExxY protein
MGELLYKELSYAITGLAFDIDNAIGFGHREKIYADGFEELLKQNGIKYEREVYCPLKIGNKVIAKKYFDFKIEDKLIVELKTGDYMYKESCSQLFSYLKTSKLQLGLVIRFTKNGVKIKRIPNIRD